MLKEMAADTNIMMYLMIIVGVIGILSKVVNQITLRRLVKAAGSMSKSTHKLIKLVRAKYEHACMAHDAVENTDAFVEKYIFEYRGFLFRIHTWRQLELQAIWFSGILAALGASVNYLSYGFTESVFQYMAAGAAEMVFLFVIRQLSDEPYKINAAKNYMVDYLENTCSGRYKKQKAAEKEAINVIAAPNTEKVTPSRDEEITVSEERASSAKPEPNLSINIEGEPRDAKKGDAAKQIIRRTVKEKIEENEEPTLKEETIRQILEEFLA
ncbi:hypothetical protein OCV51_10640 [Faecalicatena acetigenes]|uniref:Uncharacterized protein n=1 Tax=Faecalicatena acetigenes TaxID=2981790 RepID=A0ABT2TEK5_9FIRM|nr:MULTISPECIES: hypothetical protein [Lachnospiraceae]MCU6748104.1 hypothetical protein [Faecalicatena acetigenes]SCI26418.1 Uncharacterised protein [uncultured Clostridium sp.]